MIKTDCPDCGGSGCDVQRQIKESPMAKIPCPSCQGSGSLYREETDLEVPDGYEYKRIDKGIRGASDIAMFFDEPRGCFGVPLPHKVGDKSVCSVCGGSGCEPEDKMFECSTCLGKTKTVVKIEVIGIAGKMTHPKDYAKIVNPERWKLITWWMEL